jgi:hypothetical protein
VNSCFSTARGRGRAGGRAAGRPAFLAGACAGVPEALELDPADPADPDPAGGPAGDVDFGADLHPVKSATPAINTYTAILFTTPILMEPTYPWSRAGRTAGHDASLKDASLSKKFFQSQGVL